MEQTANIVSFPGLGWEFEIDRVAFHIGSLPVYWYGILIALGFILAILYVTKRAKEFGVDPDRMLDVVLGGAIGGIVGARAYFVLLRWDYYGQNLDQIFNTRSGGMAIYGGLIGGLLVGLLMCKLRKVKAKPALDLVVGGFFIGQCIGRWGNFINVEAFGGNTGLPWGMSSPTIVSYLTQHEAELEAIGMNIDPNMPVHPTFLYESLWCLLGFVLIAWYTKRRRFDGELTLLYTAWYGAGRAVIEGLRTDSLMVGSFRISQVIAAVSVIAALCIWLALRKKYKDKPLTVTYTALVKEDGRQVPYEFSWLSGETPPTDAEMKAEIERRRAARAAEETAQAEEKAPETEESGGASGVREQREAEADTQAAPEEEQAAPVQEAAADAAEKDGSDAEPKE